MSGTQVSGFPNVLFNAPAAYEAAGAYQHNQLLNTEAQQNIAATDMDQVSRAANWIDTLPAEQKPQAYQAARAQLQSAGFAKNAPAEYPGDQAITMLARQGLTVPQQYSSGVTIPPGLGAALQGNQPPGGNPPAQGGQPPATGGQAAMPAPGGAYGAGGPNQAQVPAEYMPFYQEASQRTGIPVDVLIAQHRQESGFNPDAVGRSGEIGIGQIMPATAKAPGYGVAPIDPAMLKDPRTNINFSADYLRARLPPGTDPSDPVAIRRALLNYNGGGDPNYVANVTRYLPASAGGGPAVASTTTAPPRPTTATTTAGPVTVGDSLASPGGLGGSGVVGASPSAVRAQIAQGVQNGAYTGKDVVLSSGASNAPGDMENVEAQLKQLRDASSVTLLGVGPAIEAKNPGTNANLAKLAAQYGAKFQPLPGDQMSPDGVHPNAAGYATLKTATAPPGAAPQGGRYQVASNAPVGPPSATAPPGQPPVAPAPPAAPVVAQGGQPPATAQPPAQPSGPQANLPHASEVPHGQNSPQYQEAQRIQQQISQLMPYAALPAAKAKIAQLQAQQQLLMQTDNIVQTQEGQLHVLTGLIDKTAAPLADYHETTPGSGIWVGGPGTEPKFQPPGRLVIDKAGNVWQTSVGGAHMLSPTDPQAITALNAAQAQGSATGTDVGKQLPAMIAQARAAAQQEGQIDYATNQLREAAKGGIPSGYFSDALATAAAAAKSLGIDTSSLGVNPQAVGNMQTAQKTLAVIGGAILQQAIGKDSQITNDKIEAFIHTQPGIQNDPQALQRIMAWARSQYTYEREMGQAAVAQAAQSPTGTLPLNWQAQYYHTHGFAPVYDPGTQEMQQPDGRQPARETPPPASTQQQAPALPPDAVAKLKDGVNTHFGNGQTWTLQNGKPVRVQ